MKKHRIPYENGKFRITKAEWEALNAFFASIEPPAQDELFASGDHYMLALKLRKLGFHPTADAFEVYALAERVILLGWDGDGHEDTWQNDDRDNTKGGEVNDGD